LFLLTFSLEAFSQAYSLQEIAGATTNGSNTSANFSLNLTSNNGITFGSSAKVSDTVLITGSINPDQEDLGFSADIFAVLVTGGTAKMREENGNYVNWNGKISDLLPYPENITLTEELQVEVYKGEIGKSGQHKFFLAYLRTDRTVDFPAFVRHFLAWKNSLLQTSLEKHLQCEYVV
jgi:hypothetical protein